MVVSVTSVRWCEPILAILHVDLELYKERRRQYIVRQWAVNVDLLATAPGLQFTDDSLACWT